MITKNIHYFPDLEAAVLGISMLEKTAFGRTHNIIDENVFYSDGNKLVYDALKKMYQSGLPIDLLTVHDFIQQQGVDHIANWNVGYYLASLTHSVTSSAHIEYHCWILKRMWMEREVIRLTHGGLKLEGDINNQLIQLQTAIRNIKEGDYAKEWFDMSELMIDLIKHQERIAASPDDFIKTGIKELDQKNGGFFAGNMVVIGARPGVGKSALMGQMAMSMASANKKVGILSLEMNNTEIAGRLAAIDTNIDFNKIFRNLFADEKEKTKFFNRVSSTTATLPIYVSDTTKVSPTDIRSKADKLKSSKGVDILFIDYLQLITAEQSKNKTRENVVSEISRACKIMAKDLAIPVVVLCQLNRDVTKRHTGQNRYPQLSDLRESGAIEQDADIVMFLHSDWNMGIVTDEAGYTTENKRDLIVRKWRNGEPNLHLPLEFDGPKMSFKFSGRTWKAALPLDVDYTDDNPF